MALVINDLVFLKAYSSKISYVKKSEKNVFLEKCLLYMLFFSCSPYNDAF
jgi:hypothetical protein